MFAYSFALLERVKTDRKGVTALEYGIIAGVLVAALGVAFTQLTTALSGVFGTISAAV